MIFFFNGRALQQLVGYRPKEKLRNEVKEMVANCPDCFRQSTPLESKDAAG